ncbi:MAG: LptF/LptG family permease [Planctomycetota bacterium]|nr:LptF/LptG family permease [Planctomycetota bacterium]MEC8734583.1 LptF/LptG family permease [Planctomycetota bacterium]MEC9156958.1 LptF/LptG family permease [Planctomycetota bacterium]MED5507536.1 LptF/LptG family permease [Planctomycetota bacterium]
MPRLLWRYTCAELLKVMSLTTLVLVVVIAFGATIKPLVQNQIDPLDVGKYAFFASVPMLQFAIPFAAGFAATVVMHRMTIENEVLVMSVSGVPYRRVFAPPIVLGLLLTVLMLVLVNFVIPRFWGLLQEMVTRDVTRIFTSSIERGEAISIEGTQLYADEVLVSDEPPETGADQRLVLLGVAAVEEEKSGAPRSEFTARYATVDVYHTQEDALLKLALVDATIYRPDDGSLIFVPRAVPQAVRLRKDMASGPKTKNLLELLRLRHDNDDFRYIAKEREALQRQLAITDLWNCLSRQLESSGRLEFDSTTGIDRVTVSDLSFEGARMTGTPALKLTQFEDGEPIRRATAPEAEVSIRYRSTQDQPTFLLTVPESEAFDLRGPVELRARWPERIRALEVPDCRPVDRSGFSSAQLVTAAVEPLPGGIAGPTQSIQGELQRLAKRLANEMSVLDLEITARILHRIGQSITAFLLLMLGAVLAVLLRRALPLTIYALAFIPAVLDILLLSGGEQMVKYGSVYSGTVLMFSGNLLMVLIIAVAWYRVSRN